MNRFANTALSGLKVAYGISAGMALYRSTKGVLFNRPSFYNGDQKIRHLLYSIPLALTIGGPLTIYGIWLERKVKSGSLAALVSSIDRVDLAGQKNQLSRDFRLTSEEEAIERVRNDPALRSRADLIITELDLPIELPETAMDKFMNSGSSNTTESTIKDNDSDLDLSVFDDITSQSAAIAGTASALIHSMQMLAMQTFSGYVVTEQDQANAEIVAAKFYEDIDYGTTYGLEIARNRAELVIEFVAPALGNFDEAQKAEWIQSCKDAFVTSPEFIEVILGSDPLFDPSLP